MSMLLGTSNGPRCEINVTPMIDLLLVLIIIFMLVTPHTQGLKTELPQKSTQPQPRNQPETSVVLQIRRDPLGAMALNINHNDVKWEELDQRLKDTYKTRAEKILFITASSDVAFEDVAHAIDVASHAVPTLRIGLAPADMG